MIRTIDVFVVRLVVGGGCISCQALRLLKPYATRKSGKKQQNTKYIMYTNNDVINSDKWLNIDVKYVIYYMNDTTN